MFAILGFLFDTSLLTWHNMLSNVSHLYGYTILSIFFAGLIILKQTCCSFLNTLESEPETVRYLSFLCKFCLPSPSQLMSKRDCNPLLFLEYNENIIPIACSRRKNCETQKYEIPLMCTEIFAEKINIKYVSIQRECSSKAILN